jgi:hypothetical protein
VGYAVSHTNDRQHGYFNNLDFTYCVEGLRLKWGHKGPMGLDLEAVDDNVDDGVEVLHEERT